MSRSLDRALAYLDRHLNREVTPTDLDDDPLASMRRLMMALGDPQLDVSVIQVTGTNGKGSVTAMLTSLLTAMGLTVGSFSSPHVSSITERLKLSGEPISPEAFADVVAVLEATEAVTNVNPSWFELVTAAAYRWFADEAVDVAVVEVGMLGRDDATSVVDPVVAVVTNVGYDHTSGGDGWRQEIAEAKAGIIKPTSMLCLGETDEDLEHVFLAERPALVLRRHDDFDCLDNVLAVGGRSITLRSPRGLYEDVYLGLHGAHQGDNAAIALAAAESFIGQPLPDDVVEEAFATVELPGRFEVLAVEPLIIIDGAHNPQGAEAATATLNESFSVGGRRFLVVGLMHDKDAGWMLEALGADEAELVICTAAATPRAMPATVLGEVARSEGYDVEVVPEVADALDRALALATEEDVVFVAGSLYVAGAVRDSFLARSDGAF